MKLRIRFKYFLNISIISLYRNNFVYLSSNPDLWGSHYSPIDELVAELNYDDSLADLKHWIPI
jgi:hypothetical protein